MTQTATAPATIRETYAQMRARHQGEVDAFPMRFAFSRRQFDEVCRELRVTDPAAELYRIPGGGFIRKTDSDAFHKMFERHDREQNEAMRDFDFAVGAFRYELANHEYCVTHDPDDALRALGYEAKTVKQPWDRGDGVVIEFDVFSANATFGGDEMLARAFCKAVREYSAEAERKGWC